MTMTNTTKLQAHDKAFANMHQLSIEMATTRLKIESKLSDPLNMEQSSGYKRATEVYYV